MLDAFNDVLNYSLLIGAVIAILSAIIQGYSGFGGGLIIVPALAILFGPIPAIAITSIAALFGMAVLLPDAVKKAYWPEVAPVTIANVTAMSIGLLFLVSADPTFIRHGMGVFILFATVVLMTGWTYSGQRNAFTSASVGALSGGIMGSFGIPAGPFMVIYYLSSPVAPPVQRANMVVTVGVAIVFLIGGLYVQGAYIEETILRTLVLVPAFVAGSWIGKYLFNVAPTTWFKKVIYAILLATGVIALTI
tara:strand:+ start:7300 stop:8046 length:747 start_codon:yes stop_codon:yes gene_type:complete